jgi:ABC-type amino acid transport substrate-binding protein
MKKLGFILIAALLSSSLNGCGLLGGYRSLRSIRSEGIIRVLVNSQNGENPYAYADGDAASGYEIDIIDEFAWFLEVDVEYAPATPEFIEAALRTGVADMAVGKLAPELPNGYRRGYSLPHMSEKIVFLCDSSELLGAADELSGRRVGVVSPAALRPLAEKTLKGAVLEDVPSLEDAAQYLADRRVDVLMCCMSEAEAIVESFGEGIKCVELSGVEALDYCVFINSLNSNLLDAYNRFLTEAQIEAAGGLEEEEEEEDYEDYSEDEDEYSPDEDNRWGFGWSLPETDEWT